MKLSTIQSLLLLLHSNSCFLFSLPVPVEFCKWETFNATCQPGEVVLITRARYGRMRAGNCLNSKFGHFGCHADVLAYLDSRCSGRQSCNLVATDQTLDQAHEESPCPAELAAYLEVHYRCLRGRVKLNYGPVGVIIVQDTSIFKFQ